MKPIEIIQKDGTFFYKYNYKELIRFIRRGKMFGDVGVLLMKCKDNYITYKGFGTIEHPNTDMQTITLMHNPIFDGKLPHEINFSDEDKKPSTIECNFVMLDFSTNKITKIWEK
jgi:hypothetical protein